MRMIPSRLLSAALSLVVLVTSSGALAKPHKKKDAGMQLLPDDAPSPAKAPVPAAAAESKGLNSLTLACSPPGADVFVDAQNIGKAPIELPVPVSNGGHTLKVSKLGYAPYIDAFTAKPGKQVKLEIELAPVAGVLHVTANIKGARVLVDGKYVGEAPTDVEMDVGARAIQVEKGCYTEFFQNVLAVAGKDENLDVKLAELPQNETNPCYVKPLPPPKWYQKKWVWGVVAAAAVLIAGGIVVGATVHPPGFLDAADVTYQPTTGAILSF